LEVKKEEGKIPKSSPKKRGRPSKENIVTKEIQEKKRERERWKLREMRWKREKVGR
jgi:hypothetical protein